MTAARVPLILVGVLWMCDPARAGPIEAAAAEVIQAHDGKDQEALQDLAVRRDPDPWLVADEICCRGRFEAATAFVRATDAGDAGALLAFVESRRGKPVDADMRRRALESESALGERDHARVLALTEDISPSGDLAFVRSLRARADALANGNRYEKAAAAYDQCRLLASELGWRLGELSAGHFRGICLLRMARAPEALECYRRNLELSTSWELVEDALHARIMAAICLRKLGRYGQALDELEPALRSAEEQGAKELWLLAATARANTLQTKGDRREALGAHAQALEIAESLGDLRAIARCLNNIGLIHKGLGDYEQALEYYGRSRRIKTKINDRRGAALTLNNIGNVQRRLGNLSRALSCQLGALNEFEELRDAGQTANSLVSLSATYRGLGELPKALEYANRALDFARERGIRRIESVARLNLGLVHHLAGRHAEALTMLEESLAISRDHGWKRGEASALNDLGMVYEALGDHGRALEFYEEANRIKEKIGDPIWLATSLANIANVHRAHGHHAAALEYHGRAKAIWKKIGNDFAFARIVGDIGTDYRHMGDLERARAEHERALALMRDRSDRMGETGALRDLALDLARLGEPDGAQLLLEESLAIAEELRMERDVAKGRFNLAEILVRLDRPEEALEAARDSVRLVSRLAGGLGEELAATAREDWAHYFEFGMGLAASLADPAAFSWFLESARAGALLESLGGRGLLRSTTVPEELRALEAEARSAEASAVALYRRAVETGTRTEVTRRREAVDDARARVVEVVDRIQREAKAAANLLYPEPTVLSSIQNCLRSDEAMVAYALFGAESLALVVTRADARLVELGPADRIEAAGCTDPFQQPRSEPTGPIAELRKLVAMPLRLKSGIGRVLVLPDGVLSYVPFALLFPEREVAFVPSGTTYRMLRDELDRRGEGTLAVGDPDYGSRPFEGHGTPTRGDGLVPLPGTRSEVEAIGSTTLVGSKATETGFREAVGLRARWRAVHLACHGRVDSERAILSSLALGADERHDGFLTCLDVFQLHVPADLVVLSACQTARGKIYRAEGVVGLVRAFMFAGSPRVIASTWKVDDAATKALMVKFYELWEGGGVSTAAALKRAQEFVASHEKWRHPYYWAAWQLWGLPD